MKFKYFMNKVGSYFGSNEKKNMVRSNDVWTEKNNRVESYKFWARKKRFYGRVQGRLFLITGKTAAFAAEVLRFKSNRV